MFALHEITRRRWCRVAFVLFCLVPTMSVVGWAIWLGRPEYRQMVANRLSQRLGFTVTLARVSTPHPELTLLEGVELADPETGRRLARARLVEVNGSGAATTVAISQPELDFSDWACWRGLVERELRQPRGTGGQLQVTASELTLHMGHGEQTLTDLQCQVDTNPQGSQATCSFRLAGHQMPEPALVRIQRNRQTTPPSVGFEVQTGQAMLSAGLLSAVWPAASRLGEYCRFRGTLRASETAAGWDGELVGELVDVDLNELVSTHFPHKLNGRANLVLERLQFSAGQVAAASGTITAGPGLVGKSLVKAAIDGLGFVPAGEFKTLGNAVPYEQLAAAFSVDQHGLAIRGKCDEPAAGTLLRDRTGPLVLEPQRASQPMVNLLRVLIPYQEIQVPFSRELSSLLPIFPAPAVQPAANADGSSVPRQARAPRLVKPASRPDWQSAAPDAGGSVLRGPAP